MKKFGKRFLALFAAAAVAVTFAGCSKSSSSSSGENSSEKKATFKKDDPKSVLTYCLERKDAASFSKLVGNEISEENFKDVSKKFKSMGLFDEDGKIRVKNVKLVDDEYAGISVFCDGKEAKKKPYLVFFMVKKGETWILKDIEDDKSADGKQMTESNIKYKCNR